MENVTWKERFRVFCKQNYVKPGHRAGLSLIAPKGEVSCCCEVHGVLSLRQQNMFLAALKVFFDLADAIESNKSTDDPSVVALLENISDQVATLDANIRETLDIPEGKSFMFKEGESFSVAIHSSYPAQDGCVAQAYVNLLVVMNDGYHPIRQALRNVACALIRR
jgi:hypothetical protein